MMKGATEGKGMRCRKNKGEVEGLGRMGGAGKGNPEVGSDIEDRRVRADGVGVSLLNLVGGDEAGVDGIGNEGMRVGGAGLVMDEGGFENPIDAETGERDLEEEAGMMWFSTSGLEMSMTFAVRRAIGSIWNRDATSETLRCKGGNLEVGSVIENGRVGADGVGVSHLEEEAGMMWFLTSGLEMSTTLAVRKAIGSFWNRDATSETLREVVIGAVEVGAREGNLEVGFVIEDGRWKKADLKISSMQEYVSKTLKKRRAGRMWFATSG
nr:hypothetical protein Iba_chr01cCG6750 [Ipomoea batatas]